MADDRRKQVLHQLGAKLQEVENQNPIKLHQLGAKIISVNKLSAIIDKGNMPPAFGIVPWRHHVLITSKSNSIEEAFYYIQRTIDEGLSRRELEDIIDDDAFSKQGKAIANFTEIMNAEQSQQAVNVLKDPYNLDFLQLEKGYNERDLESALTHDITHFLLELGTGFTYVGRQKELIVGSEIIVCGSFVSCRSSGRGAGGGPPRG